MHFRHQVTPNDLRNRQHKSSRQKRLFLVVSTLLLLVVSGGALVTLPSSPLSIAHAAGSSAVTTYKNDNSRSGLNSNETVLNQSNVNQNSFGKRVQYPVDGQIYAQPLFVPGLTINGTTHNVVFVATEHDTIYAFDSDQTTPTQPLWQTNYLTNGATSVLNTDVSCNDMTPYVGITGTPVIDAASNTMYVVVFTKENSALVYRLHAVDITTGKDKWPATVLGGSVQGSGVGNVNGKITFDPHVERQRGSLLLVNGNIYIPFASFCDNGNYHGWIMSYTPNNNTFTQSAIYNASPDGKGGGIWGGEGAISADANGNIYAETGNGDFNLNANNGRNAGDAFIKLNASLQLTDYFSPFNQLCLQQTDADLGSGTPLMIPGTNLMVGSGKEGRLYLLNMSNMGKYTNDPNLSCNNTTERSRTNIDKIVQELGPSTIGGLYSTPTYWNSKVFFAGYGDSVKAFSFNDNGSGLLSTKPIAESALGTSPTGGSLDVSSNGTTPGSALLWMLDRKGILHAYNPDDLAQEFYNSAQNPNDAVDSFVKFTTVTVTNGEVFVPTQNNLIIYGLRPAGVSTPTPTNTPNPTGTYNNVGVTNDATPAGGNFDGGNDSYSAQALQSKGITPGATVNYNGMNFTWPTPAAGQMNNYIPNGQVLTVNPVTNANTLGVLGASISGASSGQATITYTDNSTSQITLGFGDWTLNAGRSPVSFGNGLMATLPYRDTAAGQEAVTTYIFYAEFATTPGKTIQSITLPTATSGGQLHVFTVGTKYVPPTQVTYNNSGISDDASPAAANIDGGHYSYSKQALQAAGINPGDNAFYNYNGMVFWWPAAAVAEPDNYIPSGQTIPVTTDPNTNLLGILGTSVNGPSSGRAYVNYTDGTSAPFTLGFSDWTLNAGRAPVSFGNGKMAVMPYRNGPNGQQVLNTYLFYTDTFTDASKTVMSVTLPKTTTGGQMHVFAIATKSVTNPGGTPSTAPYNNAGVSSDAAPAGGSFDGTSSYSSQAAQSAGLVPGASVNVFNTTFVWPSPDPGYYNNYSANGQEIPVAPVTNAGAVAFLGAATNGPSTGQATITYTDGTTQSITLTFSDWTLGAGNQSLAGGNQIAVSMPYRNRPNGRDNTNTFLFYQDFNLQAGKTLKSVILPTHVNQGVLHVFAVATHTGTAMPAPAYNNLGISKDTNTRAGNFDNGGYSYSAQALQGAGVKEGSQFVFKGTSFIWTGGAAGTNSDYVTNGQTLPVNGVYGANTIAFLGSGSNAPVNGSSGTVTINYVDGSTQTIKLNFSDWTLGAGKQQPVAGTQAALTMPYRNASNGQNNTRTYVFYSEFLLNYNVAVRSVTLPTTVSGGQLHVFAVGTR